ncbi:hypothetical protein [Haloferula sp. BvORR071]|uniref:pilus assembly PilX family protein n=1 Tax=Haloferula sp. BvORR071 TaxID=1396141 RepID=UPI0005543418|nr:hypothetical protein [Haloferula sp. BvORR071]
MKPNKPNRRRVAAHQRGFALVISLSLMVLLTILAVGLLSLSTVSLRSAGAGQARAEAEANARMALNLAIGELQVTMGPDQAISARASSIDPASSEPNLLGAWHSWHWKPGSTGPNYSDKSQKFRRWLASIADKNSSRTVAGAKSGFKNPVWLINPETVNKPDSKDNPGAGLRGDRIDMELSKSQRGGFAWAVMDESQKAPIQLREPELEPNAKQPTKADLIARRVAPVRARPEEILPVLAPSTLGDPNKIVSLDSAVVAAPDQKEGKKVLSYQADVTPYSVGLLSDVAEGGLKTDLTTLFESTSASPNVNGQATVYNTAADGAPRWDYIRDHYQLHRKLGAGAATGAPKLSLTTADLKPATIGTMAAPAKERLLPVISKLQLMFSVVTHYNHLSDRIQFFNDKGDPKGNQNYAAPHLAYDAVVTLYNPYDVALTLPKLRVRVWDPPVLFGFKKNSDWLRQEFASGEYHNLARFQIANEHNKDARRWFTMLLTDATKSQPYGGSITLMPGEVRVFSPYVEKDWTWGMETAGGYTVRSFFDWNQGNDFGNVDGRTKNQYGIETVPGWDPRAGLQTDHLSYSTRPDPTRYNFEISNNWNGGWLAIKKQDTFTVVAKPGRGVTAANVPDFEVDLLAGSVADVTRDYLRSYKFRFSNPEAEISTNPTNPKITRTYQVGDLLQDPSDKTAGGKAPFALLTMGAKTTSDQYDASAPWLHNQPVVEGIEQNSSRVGNALDTYDVRLTEVTGFNQSPGGIEFDATTKKGYYGASLTANKGVSNVPMFRVPVLPAASLGELIPANLVSTAALPRVTHPFGNSRAHPLLPSTAVSRSLSGGVTGTSGMMLDHSYLLNDALWDSTFFSTAASFSGNSMMPSTDRKSLLTEFLQGKTKLFNARFIPLPGGKGSYEDQAKDLDGLGDDVLAKRMASVMGIKGPFNVNSDSVDAWKAMLTSLREQQLLGWNNSDMAPTKDKTGFSRMGLPIAGDNSDGANPPTSIDVKGNAVTWAGFRALSDKEIESLALAIVTEIRARGQQDSAPSLTLSEFVNRRPGSAGSLHALEGLLQRAINQSGVNDAANGRYSKKLGSVSSPTLLTGISTPQARSGYDSKTGYSAEGSPPLLTQGDLLMALAPVITVRGDTFRIRAYGEARDPDGKVTAKAWCEAIVQRVPEYLDTTDTPDVKPGLLKDVNEKFGRRFNITSFRWLSPEEV